MIRIFLFFLFYILYSDITAQLRIDTSKTIDLLVNKYFVNTNKGVQIDKIKFIGTKRAIGFFNCEYKYNRLIEKGIILSTGNVINAIGPNNKNNSGVNNYFRGDSELEKLSKEKSFDAAIIEFEFIPLTDSISFNYIFASEEYPEYVFKGVNDVFAFFVKNLSTNEVKNIALLPLTNEPVSIDNINSQINKEYYIHNESWDNQNILKWENDLEKGELAYLFQFDGLTKILTAGCKVVPFNNYLFKISISDIGDGVFDSWVLLEANSFISNGKRAKPNQNQIKNYLNKCFPESEILFSNYTSKISLISDIKFAHDIYKIPPETLPLINYIYQLLDYTNLHLEIHGYADDVGTDQYNLSLSRKRANSVAEYLISKGINKNRLEIYAEGELKNFNSSASDEKSIEKNRAGNRKVEFIFK